MSVDCRDLEDGKMRSDCLCGDGAAALCEGIDIDIAVRDILHKSGDLPR